MRRRHGIRLGTALASACGAALALAGCSGASAPQVTVTVTAGAPATGADAGSSSASTAAAVRACSIVTKADAEAIVTAQLQDGQEGLPTDPSCEYDTSPTGPRTAQVRFLIGDGAKNTYDVDRGLKHAFTRVAGVGDEAWEEPFAIFVRKGTTWFAITVVLPDDPSVAAKPLQVAATAALPKVP